MWRGHGRTVVLGHGSTRREALIEPLAVIFDMDGVIVDSEPFWQRVEIDVFGRLGIPLDEQLCRSTMGLRIDEVVTYWLTRYPDVDADPGEVRTEIVEGVAASIEAEAALLPGVRSAIALLRDRGLRLALASSSDPRLIDAVVERLALRDVFEIRRSAADEDFGKPHPAVYISTAAILGIPPDRCVAIEDAPNGVLAAKAARMGCIAVPDRSVRDAVELGLADLVLGSLEELDGSLWEATFAREQG